MKSYKHLISLPSFEERFEYLRLSGEIGLRTFGGNRYLNQALYTSKEWRKFRRDIIVRDEGRDLAMPGYELNAFITVHHLNPLTEQQVLARDPCIFDPDNVVCVSDSTHKAIHYGDAALLPPLVIERSPNDTCPWR